MNSSLLLDRLLNFKETSSLIIIEDKIIQSGYVLLKEFIKRTNFIDDHATILLCAEHSPDWVLKDQSLRNEKFIIIDAYTFSNPYEVIDDEQIEIPLKQYTCHFIKKLDDCQAIFNLIQEIITKLKSPKFTLIIDSLAPFPSDSNPSIFILLKKLSNLTSGNRCVAVFHSDIPSLSRSHISMRNSIAHLATTIITVKNSKRFHAETSQGFSFLSDDEEIITKDINSLESAVCSIEHKKRSGKVLHEINSYQIMDNLKGEFIIKLPDPTNANLLFNLSLTEKQKVAKNEVVLPYTKIQEQYESQSTPSASSGSGVIYYEPDEGDDFDDEDPDEDLTI
ncbi:6894_t:CDS:2 [Ambispora leptoticha]|uniref:Elongator complex protein 5 n=1 Tax=Ambispora leptoticha TaxID=144679 RepID=A0A9N9FFD6_9GLOM|nr:6894_t:CDS:2 [Ambispora leptoticha]